MLPPTDSGQPPKMVVLFSGLETRTAGVSHWPIPGALEDDVSDCELEAPGEEDACALEDNAALEDAPTLAPPELVALPDVEIPLVGDPGFVQAAWSAMKQHRGHIRLVIWESFCVDSRGIQKQASQTSSR